MEFTPERSGASSKDTWTCTYLIDYLQNDPILTLADSPNATAQGIAINMSLINEKIVFEINLIKARASGLDISSKLLQLAVKVHQ